MSTRGIIEKIIRSLFTFILAFLLIIAFIPSSTYVKATSIVLKINPSYVSLGQYGQPSPVAQPVTISVEVENVVDLFLWQVVIYYNNNILSTQSDSMWLPPNHVFSGKQISSMPPSTGSDANGAYIMMSVSLLGGEPTFTGSGTLCKVNFTTVGTPGICFLNFTTPIGSKVAYYETYMCDPDMEEIPATAVEGEVEVKGIQTGPRMDSLYIRYYTSTTALYNALKNGEVDLTDWMLNQAQQDEVFNNTSIRAAISPMFVIYEFGFNNNATIPSYSNVTSPTAYKKFRQGIAHLIDKNFMINNFCNYSYRIDTPIPRPNGDSWVDWSVSQYDSYGGLLGNYPYGYNSTLAAYCFNQAGFIEGYENNTWYDPGFPGSAQYLRINPETNQTLEPLVFYIRTDPQRLAAGTLLSDNLRKMGIPVNATVGTASMIYTPVMIERNYHIYTGGWVGSFGPELLSVYSSDYEYSYMQFRNATYDEWVKKVQSPPNLTIAKEAALKCQKILVQEAACTWLWSASRVMGYRNIYGVVNHRGGRLDNRWTFLNARNSSRSEIYYGLLNSPTSLNVITDYPADREPWTASSPERDCLDRIYDTLIAYCPYDKTPGEGNMKGGGTMPWMAEDWDIGEWQSPYNPAENLTKLTFYLRSGTKWHDGVALNSSDVKFTIEYLKGLGNLTSLQSSVVDVHHVTTPDASTVCVYENVSNIWALDVIGTLPILPKHIFQNITDPTGYTPGVNEGRPANETLIGSGAWKYVNHSSSMLYLEANRAYFMETPPEGEIDYRYDWEMGSWVVDAMETTMIAEAYMSRGDTVPQARWDPGCDVAKGDAFIDMFDVVIVGKDYNKTWGKSAKRYISPPPTDTAIYIQPLGNPIVVGENLTVYVKLDNLIQMSGVQFKLYFDNNKLYCLNLTIHQIFNNTYEAKKEINQTEGFIWVSITSMGITQPISGNTTLATIIFNATKPSGSTLDLLNTKLAIYGAPGTSCQLMNHNTLDRSVMVGVTTPTGTNITVAPAENTQVTFASTTSQGVTTLNITQPPSAEFVSVLCHDIETTANYTGNVTVQFAYDSRGLSLEDEESMKIWLWDEISGSWVDITTDVDTANDIVYGVAPHLSAFGITSDLNVEGDMGTEIETNVCTPQDPPPGLAEKNLTELKYYQINATESYTPPVTVRLEYDDTGISLIQEIFARIWLWDDTSGGWTDVTTRVDIYNNIIYATAPHLSAFGITSLMPVPQNLTVINAATSKTVVAQGYNVTISFTLQNIGDFTKDFNATLYCNMTTFAQYSVTLEMDEQTDRSFKWMTANFAKGNYAISVCDHLISWVVVTMAGDVNGDFRCEGKDNGAVAKAYDTQPGHPRWNPNADINCDNRVEGKDVGVVAKYYGQSDP